MYIYIYKNYIYIYTFILYILMYLVPESFTAAKPFISRQQVSVLVGISIRTPGNCFCVCAAMDFPRPVLLSVFETTWRHELAAETRVVVVRAQR